MATSNLQMIFKNAQGRNMTISVSNPVVPVNSGDVQEAMDLVLNKNIFLTGGGEIQEKVGAQLINREVIEIISF